MPKPTRGEIVFVLLWAAFVVVLAGLPYVIAASWAGPDRYFSGFIAAVDDSNAYLAWTRQAAEGNLFLANQYTTAFQNPRFFSLFFQATGWLCRVFGLQPIEAFHLARLVGVPVALYSFYCLCAFVTARRLIRVAALVIASLSSGLGWLFVLHAYGGGRPKAFPIDCAANWLVMPEAVTYLSFLINPLFTWSLALLSAGLLWAWAALAEGNWLRGLVAGLIVLVLGNIHTYDIPAVWLSVVFGAWLAVVYSGLKLPRAVALVCLIIAVSAPGPLWAWYTSQADPAWLAKINTPTLSPRLLDYALGFGLVLLAAVVGAAVAWAQRRKNWRPMAVVFWATVTFALAYAPVSFQRKMIEGEHLALSLLAAIGLVTTAESLMGQRLRKGSAATAPRRSRAANVLVVLALFVVLTAPSNLVFVADALGHVAANNADLLGVLMPPVYLTHDEVVGLEWLASNTTFADVVMSSSLIGNHIPAWSRARVVAGHWAETLNPRAMLRTVTTFYAPGIDPTIREEILRNTGATYVWWGQYERLIQRSMQAAAERAVGGPVETPDPPHRGLASLVEVFCQGDVVIYRVLARD
ncbi:MAG: hypothetical protein N2512_05495 [Armatimonadetes bacterium]|nr:hypothetical protein [Armatimonadota bacterium]